MAGSKQRNPGCPPHRQARSRHAPPSRRNPRENSGQSPIIPGENPPSTGTIAPLKVMRASDDNPLRNVFKEETIAFGYPRERVFPQAARDRCGSNFGSRHSQPLSLVCPFERTSTAWPRMSERCRNTDVITARRRSARKALDHQAPRRPHDAGRPLSLTHVKVAPHRRCILFTQSCLEVGNGMAAYSEAPGGLHRRQPSRL